MWNGHYAKLGNKNVTEILIYFQPIIKELLKANIYYNDLLKIVAHSRCAIY